jgi:hypothetical protein
MAVCPKCEWNVNPARMVKGEMACPHCKTPLRFNRREYRRAMSPGLFVALAMVFSVTVVEDPLPKALISVGLLLAWFIFYRGYKRYLRSATLEVKDRVDVGQDI